MGHPNPSGLPPDSEIVEIKDVVMGPDGPQATVRYASGLEVIRMIRSVSLEGQITRADGTVEPKQLLAKSTFNPITDESLRQEGVGEVTLNKCE